MSFEDRLTDIIDQVDDFNLFLIKNTKRKSQWHVKAGWIGSYDSRNGFGSTPLEALESFIKELKERPPRQKKIV